MWNILIVIIFSIISLKATDAFAQFAELHQKDRLASTHAPIVQNMLESTPTIASRFQSIRVNQPYKSGSLNIYLINNDADFSDITDHTTKRYLNNIRKNARAIPPDSIFIDNDLLSILAFNAQIDVWYRAESTRIGIDMITKKKPPMDRSKVLFLASRAGRMAGILSDIDRYDALFSKKRDLPDPTVLGTATSIAGQVFNLPNSKFSSNRFLIQASLAPLLFHEVGHLTAGAEGDFYSLIADFFDRRAREKIKIMEQKADEFSVRAIADLYNAQKLSNEPLLKMYQTVYLRQPAIASIKYMRDDAIIKLFDGYRGLKYEDLFFEIYHRACGIAYNSSYEDSRNIIYGKFGYVPILRLKEREFIKQQVNKYLSSSTHIHGIIRSNAFFEMLQSITTEDLSGLSYLYSRMLDRLINDEKELFPGYFPDKGLGVSSSDVLSILGAANVEMGQSCENCKVGELKDGYVEVLGDDNNLGVIRLIYYNNPEAADRVDRSLVLLYTLIASINKNVKEERRFMEKILMVNRMDSDICGYSDNIQSLGGITIKMRRSFRERAHMITIMAGEDADENFLIGKYRPKDPLTEAGIRGITPNLVIRPQEIYK
ncbi:MULTISPECIES: hypothetical protein [Methylobacterium]|uniref:hypothetical protein n=1 Tax=Methylobacterium TaxID=407 RepID=UPI00272E2A51|nr:hypothetical protein [Methylobacterium sp.]